MFLGKAKGFLASNIVYGVITTVIGTILLSFVLSSVSASAKANRALAMANKSKSEIEALNCRISTIPSQINRQNQQSKKEINKCLDTSKKQIIGLQDTTTAHTREIDFLRADLIRKERENIALKKQVLALEQSHMKMTKQISAINQFIYSRAQP